MAVDAPQPSEEVDEVPEPVVVAVVPAAPEEAVVGFDVGVVGFEVAVPWTTSRPVMATNDPALAHAAALRARLAG